MWPAGYWLDAYWTADYWVKVGGEPPEPVVAGHPRQRKRRWILPDGRRFYGTIDEMLMWWREHYPARTAPEAREERRAEVVLRERLEMLGIAWREQIGREEADGEVEIDLSEIPGLEATPSFMAGFDLASAEPNRPLLPSEIAAIFADIRFRRAEDRKSQQGQRLASRRDVDESKKAVSEYRKREKRAITRSIEEDRRAVAAIKPPMKSLEDRMWRGLLAGRAEDIVRQIEELQRLRRRRKG